MKIAMSTTITNGEHRPWFEPLPITHRHLHTQQQQQQQQQQQRIWGTYLTLFGEQLGFCCMLEQSHNETALCSIQLRRYLEYSTAWWAFSQCSRCTQWPSIKSAVNCPALSDVPIMSAKWLYTATDTLVKAIPGSASALLYPFCDATEA